MYIILILWYNIFSNFCKEDKMAVCQICGKKTVFGNTVAHSATTERRTWKPNLRRVRVVLEDGSTKRIYVCAKCLKAGKVKKAV
jgi:large subunit ribosomal protein L28